jgi:hypothetical protein
LLLLAEFQTPKVAVFSLYVLTFNLGRLSIFRRSSSLLWLLAAATVINSSKKKDLKIKYLKN